MLNLLLLSPTWNGITGADRDWLNLANALDPREFALVWAGQQGCEQLRPHLNPELRVDFVDLDFPKFAYLIQENAYLPRSRWLWTKILADHALRQWRPFGRLRQALAGRRIDLVVSNTAAVTLGPACAALLGKPHVWFVKECLDVAVPECRRLADLISRWSDAVVVPSRAVAASFRRRVHVLPDGSPARTILEAARGIDPAAVRQRLGLPVERPLIAQVGGGQGWKGQHVLAQALVQLVAAGAAPPCSVLFLGQLAPAYQRQLEEILAATGPDWRQWVRFATFSPDDFSLVQAADLVVHPSVLPDPYPNAVREAMLLGKPVIGSTAGGIPEMIQDDVTGKLVPPGQAEPLARALHELLANSRRRREMGEVAQKYARQTFDIEICQTPFVQLFHQLTHTRNGAGRRRDVTRADSTANGSVQHP